jgi:hypothetical protein
MTLARTRLPRTLALLAAACGAAEDDDPENATDVISTAVH